MENPYSVFFPSYLGYKSYENVWAEIKNMGDEADKLVDNNTLGGVHFG